MKSSAEKLIKLIDRFTLFDEQLFVARNRSTQSNEVLFELCKLLRVCRESY